MTDRSSASSEAGLIVLLTVIVALSIAVHESLQSSATFALAIAVAYFVERKALR